MATLQDKMAGQQQQPSIIQGAMLSPEMRRQALLQNIIGNIGNLDRGERTVNPLSSLQDARAKQVSLQNSLTNQEYQKSLIEQQRQQQMQAEEQAKRQTALQQHMAGMQPQEKVDFMLQSNMVDDAILYVDALKKRKDLFSPDVVDQLEGLSTGYIDYLKSNEMPPSPEAYNDYISRKGSGVTVNVGSGGQPKLPADHMWVDPENPRAGVVPLPGSPPDLERREREVGVKIARGVIADAAQTVYEDVDRGLEVMDTWGHLSTGPAAAITSWMPTAPADQLKKHIKSIQGNIGIDTILKIKKEGAGLGQIPHKQFEMLADVLGKLDADMRHEDLRYNFKRIGNLYGDIVRELGDDPETVYNQRRKEAGLTPSGGHLRSGSQDVIEPQPLSTGGQFEGFKVLSVE